MANKLWDEKYRAFTAAMKTLRTDRNLTQTDLANRLGKPQSFVSKYESGERTLDFVETLAVCEALNADVQEIIVSYKKSMGVGKG
jgi:transcriptional regulator with XRE-family HTH domain